MNGALEILKRERDEASDQIRVLRVRIRDLEAAIAVLEVHPTQGRSGKPTGDLKQGVLNQLDAFGERGGTPKEISDALGQLGRPTSEPSISSTLSRLKNESKVVNRGGRWFAASVQEAPSPLAKTTQWDDDLDEDVPF